MLKLFAGLLSSDNYSFSAGLHRVAGSFSKGALSLIPHSPSTDPLNICCDAPTALFIQAAVNAERLLRCSLLQHQEHGGKPLPVDVYGSGEDMQAIKKRAKEDGLAITFNSGIDHLDDAIHAYR